MEGRLKRVMLGAMDNDSVLHVVGYLYLTEGSTEEEDEIVLIVRMWNPQIAKMAG